MKLTYHKLTGRYIINDRQQIICTTPDPIAAFRLLGVEPEEIDSRKQVRGEIRRCQY